MSICNICDIPKKFYDLPEHGAATTKARGGLGTVQTSWARREIKIMAVDSCDNIIHMSLFHYYILNKY